MATSSTGTRASSAARDSRPMESAPATEARVAARATGRAARQLMRPRRANAAVAESVPAAPCSLLVAIAATGSREGQGGRALHIQVTHVLIDRGSCFTADGFEAACQKLGVKHRKTRPYTPRTNGMVERFNGLIQRDVLAITV